MPLGVRGAAAVVTGNGDVIQVGTCTTRGDPNPRNSTALAAVLPFDFTLQELSISRPRYTLLLPVPCLLHVRAVLSEVVYPKLSTILLVHSAIQEACVFAYR